MIKSLVIGDWEESQAMIGPSVTPASPNDEDEMEIHFRKEDLIDHRKLFDPDWPPGWDGNYQWVVQGPPELVIDNPEGAPWVGSN